MFRSPRNQGGRPRKAVDEKRSAKVSVRLTRDELARIEGLAASAGATVAEHLRATAVGNVTIRQSRDLSPIDRHDLHRIAVDHPEAAPAILDFLARRHELV